MSNFKVGQKVVCIIEDNTDIDNLGLDSTGPKLNEILTISFVGLSSTGRPSLGFYEYGQNDCWEDFQFRPLDHQFAEDVIAYIKELELA